MTSCQMLGFAKDLVGRPAPSHLPFLNLLLTPSLLVFAVDQVTTQHNCTWQDSWQNKF